MTTTLFHNGRIIDGSGTPSYNGSVFIEDGLIHDVIQSSDPLPQADAVLDATGLAIAPGFIDMHSHSDWVLPAEDHSEILKCLVEQGITSIVGGNCGFSPAPINAKAITLLKPALYLLMAKPFQFKWNSMDGFFDSVQRRNPMLNMAELVGHASIFAASGDTRRGKMSSQKLNSCLDEVRKALDEGACGLSFGLGYDPGMYSPLEEVEAFCAIAKKANKPVAVHLKAFSRVSPCYPITTPKAHNVLALEEMLNVARKTDVTLQLSHFIFVGRRSWPYGEKCFSLLESAHEDGVDVMIDAFPYTCGNTTILVTLPYWFQEKIPDAYNSTFARARLKLEFGLGFRLVGFTYSDFQVMNSAVPGWENINGLRVSDVAKKWNTSPFNAMLMLAEKSNGAALMLYHTYSGEPGREELLDRVLSHHLCLFETDVAIKTSGYPNPASLGTFPKILGHYARDRNMFGLEDAVKRMTSASAERFGLKTIGSLHSGKAADIVIFDPGVISDTPPEGTRPADKPKGIKHVFINGQQVVKDGDYIDGVYAGRVLKI